MEQIDWKRVNERLRCPQCGEKAHLVGGTDGTEASHTHSFKVTRADALQLSKLTADEIREQIAEHESTLLSLRAQLTEAESDDHPNP